MKKLIIYSIFALIGLNAFAQSQEFQDRVFIIAESSNDQFQLTEFSVAELGIQKKIDWILKLDTNDFDLINPELVFEVGKGWFLQYKFNTPQYAGIYKEKLLMINGKLVIGQIREAVMAKASNCEDIRFTNDEDRCECTSKKDSNNDSELTLRLFTSS